MIKNDQNNSKNKYFNFVKKEFLSQLITTFSKKIISISPFTKLKGQ
jgi:hypothetical protein